MKEKQEIRKQVERVKKTMVSESKKTMKKGSKRP